MSSLPPAGWYDDPERPSQLRYWDGAIWTEHRAPRPDAAFGDGRLSDVGVWLESVARHMWARRVPVVVLLGVNIVAWLALVATFRWAVDGLVWDERVGWSGVEPSRLVVAGIVFAANFVVTLLAFLAVGHQMFWSRVGEPPSVAASLIASIRGMFRLLGWSILIVLAAMGLVVVITIAFVISGAAGVLVLLAAIPFVIWAWVKVSFLTVSAVVPIEGSNALRSSAEVSAGGRFWAILGRAIIITIAAGMVSFGLSVPFSGVGGSSEDFDDALVIVDDEIVRADVEAFADAAGFEVGILSALGAIGQTISPMISAAGMALMFAEVHGKPGRR